MPRFGWIKNYQRFNLDDSWKLYFSLWFFVFLIFAGRVGLASFLSLFDMHRYNMAMHIKNIELPVAENIYKPHGSARHLLYIGITKSGHYIFNKNYCEFDNIQNEIKYFYLQDPQAAAVLIIDKDVQMKNVNRLLSLLRKEELLKVYFITDEK